ncbi:unnamed protein product [Discula destructiva]
MTRNQRRVWMPDQGVHQWRTDSASNEAASSFEEHQDDQAPDINLESQDLLSSPGATAVPDEYVDNRATRSKAQNGNVAFSSFGSQEDTPLASITATPDALKSYSLSPDAPQAHGKIYSSAERPDFKALDGAAAMSHMSLGSDEACNLRKTKATSSLINTDAWLFKGIHEHIGDLALDEIVWSKEDVASRRKIDVLVEYTWLQGPPFPAVFVPGNARTWNKISAGMKLEPIPGIPPILDEHRTRQPAFPYEPTFRALLQALKEPETTDKKVNFHHVDVVSDAETLALLFSFLDNPSPTTLAPFRLELSTVHNTLFLSTAVHRSLGHTDNGNGRLKPHLPPWVRHALTVHACSSGQQRLLPFSAGHVRVVRYRMGKLVLVVRAKIDWTIDNRAHSDFDDKAVRLSMRGLLPERDVQKEEGNNSSIETFRTVVEPLGDGTPINHAGVTSVRLPGWDPAVTVAAKMPMLWFGRVPFLAAGVVAPSSDAIETRETKIFSARDAFGKWETKHHSTLKMMTGLLQQLNEITRHMGGSCVLIGDPGGRCLSIMEPTVKSLPVPSIIVAQMWGDDQSGSGNTEIEHESSMDSDSSALSHLSGTPELCEELESTVSIRTHGSARKAVTTSRKQACRKVARWLDGEGEGYEADCEDDDGDQAMDATSPPPDDVRMEARDSCREALPSGNRFTRFSKSDEDFAKSHTNWSLVDGLNSAMVVDDGPMDHQATEAESGNKGNEKEVFVPRCRAGLWNTTLHSSIAGYLESDETHNDAPQAERGMDVGDGFVEEEEAARRGEYGPEVDKEETYEENEDDEGDEDHETYGSTHPMDAVEAPWF